MTEICDRVLRAGGPALLFEQARRATRCRCSAICSARRGASASRWAWTRGRSACRRCATSGGCSRACKEPEPPKGLRDAWEKLPRSASCCKVLDMAPKVVSSRALPGVVWEGEDVDLARLPVQTCWPGDAGPLITWGLTVTRGPRQGAAEPRHLPPAGDRRRTRSSCAGSRIAAARSISATHALAHPGQPFPVAVALGADPATMLGAVTPVPDTLSRVPVRRPAARRRTELVELPSACDAAGAGRAPRSCSKAHIQPPSEHCALEGPVRRPHRLLQRAGPVPGVHDRAHHAPARPDLPLAPTPASRPTSRRCSAWR